MKFNARSPGPLQLRRLPAHWEPAVFRRIALTPCAATLGAVVSEVDLSRPLDDGLFGELDRALLEWKVLFFRDQAIDAAAQATFAQHWGPLLDDQLIPSHRDNPVENVVVFERNAQVRGLENGWHCDGSFRSEIPMGTVLRAIEVPEVGGDTLFADMAAAYDNLSQDLQKMLEDRVAVHDWSLGAYAEKYGDQLEALRSSLQDKPARDFVNIVEADEGTDFSELHVDFGDVYTRLNVDLDC